MPTGSKNGLAMNHDLLTMNQLYDTKKGYGFNC
jgi:hypothetical protein